MPPNDPLNNVFGIPALPGVSPSLRAAELSPETQQFFGNLEEEPGGTQVGRLLGDLEDPYARGAVSRAQAEEPFVLRQQIGEATGLEPEEDRGLLSTIFEGLSRWSSGISGWVTGRLNMDVYDRVYNPETGALETRIDLAEADNELATDTALRRFREGISGQRDFSFSMTTPVGQASALGEPVTGFERTANLGAGIVLDTLVDPITYVNFGGSIYGRAGASRLLGTTPDVVETTIQSRGFDSVRFWRNELTDRLSPLGRLPDSSVLAPTARAALPKVGARSEVFARVLNNTLEAVDLDSLSDSARAAVFSFRQAGGFTRGADSAEALFRLTDELSVETLGELDILRAAAMKYFPTIAAFRYHTRSADGLRRWARRTLGAQEGNAYFASLPRDIQGGVRIRMPFIRASDGTPISIPLIPYVGAGRVNEKVVSLTRGRVNLLDVSERGRDILRGVLSSTPVVRSVFTQGVHGRMVYQAINDVTGVARRNSRGASYIDMKDFRNNVAIAESAQRTFNAAQNAKKMAFIQTLNNALNGLDSADQLEVHREVARYMNDRDLITAHLANPAGLTDVQQRALQVARLGPDLFDELFQEAVKAGVPIEYLNNHSVRAPTQTERVRRWFNNTFRPGAGISGDGAGKFTKHRAQDVRLWRFEEGNEVQPYRFVPPPDIVDISSGKERALYLQDILVAYDEYFEDMNRLIRDHRFQNIMTRSGLFREIPVLTQLRFNKAIAEERILELIRRDVDDPERVGLIAQMQEALDNIQITNPDEMTRVEGELLGATLRRFGIQEEAGSSWRQVLAREDADRYVIGEDGIHRNLFDGTFLELERGSYLLKHQSGSAIVDPATGQVYRFASPEEATIATRSLFDVQRTEIYNDYISLKVEHLQEMMNRTVADFLKPQNVNGHTVIASLFDEINTNPSLSIAEKSAEMEALTSRMTEILRTFDLADAKYTKTNIGEQLKETEGIYSPEYVVDSRLADAVKDGSYLDASGKMKIESGELLTPKEQLQAKGRLISLFHRTYAPSALVEGLHKYAAVASTNPSDLGALLDYVLTPFYNFVRGAMTIGRGFGFVSRNLQSGSLISIVGGVGRSAFSGAGDAMLVRHNVAAQIRRKYGRDVYLSRSVEEIEEETRELFLREMRKKGYTDTGTYIEGVEDAEALVQILDLAYRWGDFGPTRGARRYMQMSAGASLNPDTGIWDATTASQRRSILQRYVAAGEDVIKYEDLPAVTRALNWLSTENPWIRLVMGPIATASENYLRLSTYIAGVQKFGLEASETGLRGFSASNLVKNLQFDYDDMSLAERSVLRGLYPFYTWMRNNIPLQFRVAFHQPGRIAILGRIKEDVEQELLETFAEDDIIEMPSYVSSLLRFPIAREKFNWLPQGLQPRGDIVAGIPFVDSMLDLNRFFRIPGSEDWSPINIPEIAQDMNPLITAAADVLSDNVPNDTGQYPVDAPKWAGYLDDLVGKVTGGATPLTDVDPATGRRTMRYPTREAVSTAFPYLRYFESYLPAIGDDRQAGRLFTTLLSGIFGLPVSTLQDYQYASSMERQTQRFNDEWEKMFGDGYNFRIDLIEALLAAGAPVDFIREMDIQNLDDSEIDVGQWLNFWNLHSIVNESIASGEMTEAEWLMALSPMIEGSEAQGLYDTVWQYVSENTRTDVDRQIRMFAPRGMDQEALDHFGLKPEDISRMSDEERADLGRRYLEYLQNK